MAGDLQTEILRADALANASSQPVLLTRVEVNGGDNFSLQFFAKLFSPLTEGSDYTLQQLLERVDATYDNLQKTRVFKDIQPSLHVDYFHKVPEKTTYNKDKPILTRVVYDLELDELSGSDAALAFNTEDNLAVNFGYSNNNFNHNAELVTVGVNYRPYKPSEHLVSGVRLESNLRNPAFKFVLDLHNLHDNNHAWQRNASRATAGSIGVQYLNAASTFSMFHGLALAKRTVHDFDAADESVAKYGGDFLKLSFVSRLAFRNVATLDAFPTGGVRAAVSLEISSDQEQADNSGNLACFVKVAGQADVYRSFLRNAFTTHVFAEGGGVWAPGSDSSAVHLADRFYLGGYGSFKGFARNSVNAHGGLQYYKTGATVYSKLPFFGARKAAADASPLRLYGTGMVGSVGNVLQDSGVALAGVGLRYFNKWVQMDAGYYVAQRLGLAGTHGVRDGFSLEVSVGGVSRIH